MRDSNAELRRVALAVSVAPCRQKPQPAPRERNRNAAILDVRAQRLHRSTRAIGFTSRDISLVANGNPSSAGESPKPASGSRALPRLVSFVACTRHASSVLKYFTSRLGDVHSRPRTLNVTVTSSPTFSPSSCAILSFTIWNDTSCGYL